MLMITNKTDDSGMASIITATVLMIVVSLITLGFTRVMQREQRQATDRVQSSQAFYAAESGVNDAFSMINTLPIKKTDCDVSSFPNNGVIDLSRPEVNYSCVLVDKEPTDIEFRNSTISTDQSKIFPIESNTVINSITFEWSDDQTALTLPNANCSDLPTVGAWGGSRPAMLKLDLVQTPGGTFTREQLIDSTYSMYLSPVSAVCGTNTQAIGVHLGEPNKGRVVPVSCTNGSGYQCSFTLTGLSSSQYTARIRAIYTPAERLRITAENSASPGTDLPLRNAQALIDSTGKANDVVRRIQVRVPLTSAYPLPEFALQVTDGVCKQLSYAPPSVVGYPCPQ